jgi:serine/threonine-protein phosphatase 2A activator
LPESSWDSIIELQPYLEASFGDPVRIDYGTGHELSFTAWMLCLATIGVFAKEDQPNLVLSIFVKYLDVMRKLQSVYWLEPAGSKGVWGLDDYQFLAFYWGASQLAEGTDIVPSSILNDAILTKYEHEYLYMGCIQFIKKTKTGHFAEHSPYLHDISGVESWEKVNTGLMRMYKNEVLNKFPVIQHFLFGSILRFDPIVK